MPTTEPLRSEPAPQLESTCPERRSQVLRRRASAAKQTNIFQKEKKMALTPSQPNVTSICTIFNPFTFQFLITSHHRLIYGYTVPSSQRALSSFVCFSPTQCLLQMPDPPKYFPDFPDGTISSVSKLLSHTTLPSAYLCMIQNSS